MMNSMSENSILKTIRDIIKQIHQSEHTVYIVSNEVGSGIVPENRLARNFRDIAGRANQMMAKASDEAYFLVSGIPLRLK